MRQLRLLVIEDDGEVNPIYAANHPIRDHGYPDVWEAIKFFSIYLIREWTGIISGRR